MKQTIRRTGETIGGAEVLSGTTIFYQHTAQEIESFWRSELFDEAKFNHDRSVFVSCFDHDKAVEICALFLRDVMYDKIAIGWNGKMVILYCGNSGSGWQQTVGNTDFLVRKWEQGCADTSDLFEGDAYKKPFLRPLLHRLAEMEIRRFRIGRALRLNVIFGTDHRR